ncbi:MAG: hypothetical protein PF436_02480 [Prolixibacteraceae bacterium]|jgi:glycerophosphoryl diester phosphodiesterase|nr:hypothetical protein [Prolixibacteraceae bacterium]
MNNNKAEEKIIRRLYSEDVMQISQSLNEISEHGNSSYIPMLADVLNQVEDITIKNKIVKILSEIKHTDAVPELVKAIENEKLAHIQETLVSVCWKNGLDFTNYFDTFIDIVINGEYMNAFEAFTVIENSEGTLSSTSAQEYINKLNSSIDRATTDRAILIKHLLDFLPQIVK